MNRDEWDRCDDGLAMLLWFRLSWTGDRSELDRLTQRYLLACCRRIWRLLPDEYCRRALKVGERHNKGWARRREWEWAIRDAEGAGSNLEWATAPDFDECPEADTLRRWIGEVAAIPAEDIVRMIGSGRPTEVATPEKLLAHAAYFVEFALYSYNGWGRTPHPVSRPWYVDWLSQYSAFLSAPLLRESVAHAPCVRKLGLATRSRLAKRR
ncbi:hypothetical protein TA3x_001819 [Tundrisphaera sp. TA3]|uniref:hypothetical protein n=1 Tax=Tundrisphaera sp. TA3 TaxID=3435775 RepID=UPI003EBCD3D7